MTKTLMRSLKISLSSPTEAGKNGPPAVPCSRLGLSGRLLNNLSASALACLTLLGAGLLASGCAHCKPGVPGPNIKYNVRVNLDPSLNDASVAVDIVGATPMTRPRWEDYSMTKYWQPQDEMRQGADKISFVMGSGGTTTKTIGMDDPKWKDWLAGGVTHILVLGDLPGGFEDKAGPLDARRQVLPLDQCAWPDGTTTLVVNIKRSGLEVQTAPRIAK
jgi:hypothetical protein